MIIDLILILVFAVSIFMLRTLGDSEKKSEKPAAQVEQTEEGSEAAETGAEAETAETGAETETAETNEETSEDAEAETEDSEEETQANKDAIDDLQLLVNPWLEIPDGYVDSHTRDYVRGYLVDVRIKDDLEDMLNDCEAAGHSPVIISGFRDYETQRSLYNATANKNDTAYPGTSEHECGLAVDILEAGYGSDWDNAEKTAQTETQKWLTENCKNYGFILRYPEGKEDITGIVYESWHYRYVGKKAAAEIMESGQCLEEYKGFDNTGKERVGG